MPQGFLVTQDSLPYDDGDVEQVTVLLYTHVYSLSLKHCLIHDDVDVEQQLVKYCCIPVLIYALRSQSRFCFSQLLRAL